MTMSSTGAQVKPESSKGDAEQAGEWTNLELGGRWTVGGWLLLLKAMRPQRLTRREGRLRRGEPWACLPHFEVGRGICEAGGDPGDCGLLEAKSKECVEEEGVSSWDKRCPRD